MPVAHTMASNTAGAIRLLSTDEAYLFEALTVNLPEGWVVEFKADVEMAWAAYIYCADEPRSRPLFSVCRWSDRMGLFVQWMDGSASSAVVFTELSPILDFITNGISASAQTRLAAVQARGRADTTH